jgi:hypothetical protein
MPNKIETEDEHVIYVQWGNSIPEPERPITRYVFDTPEEMRAFEMGLAESDGWLGYSILAEDELPPECPRCGEYMYGDGWDIVTKSDASVVCSSDNGCNLVIRVDTQLEASDQPTTCPDCGARTAFTERGGCQYHYCSECIKGLYVEG